MLALLAVIAGLSIAFLSIPFGLLIDFSSWRRPLLAGCDLALGFALVTVGLAARHGVIFLRYLIALFIFMNSGFS